VPPRRSWKFWTIYLTVVTVIVFGVLDVAAGVVVRRRVGTLLSIFDCILCDGRNVLTPRAGVRQVWDASPAFTVDVRTNARGFREDVDFTDAEVDVAFMGDSFAFGWGVDVEDRFSNVIAASRPDDRVVSLSYNNGFQPEHYEYFLERHPELRPRVVVVLVCLGNDLDSDARETEIDRGPDGTIADLRLPYRGLYFGVMRGAAAYSPRPLGVLVEHTNVGRILGAFINQSPELRGRFTAPQTVLVNTSNPPALSRGRLTDLSQRAFIALTRIKAHVESYGGVLHVVLVPEELPAGPGSTGVVYANGLTDAVLQRCAQDALSCHDLAPHLTERADFIQGDGHWTPQGHAKVAGALRPLVAPTPAGGVSR
jgi:hypothetical protein